MHRKWFVARTNPEFISYLSSASSISPAFAQVLINRGLKTPEDVSRFVSPALDCLCRPSAIDGMEKAVGLIKTAKKIFVHGDYDVDGISSTAITVDALRKTGLDVHYFIPNRFEHGYGFNSHAVGIAKAKGADLIITVDCGISSFDAVRDAKKEGLAVIITDHHEPRSGKGGFIVPEADVVINPKLSSSEQAVMDLSGAGIAFKLAHALMGEGAFGYLDLAAMGTLADVVPLTGENRTIVKEGITLINEGKRKGIKALKRVSGIEGRDIRPGLLCFTMLPRINAAGRISDGADAVELFLSDSEEKTTEIALRLDGLNSKRQEIEEAVYGEALRQLDAKQCGPAIVLWGGGWHEGVIGIVASRLAEKFYRPAFVFSVSGGIAKGSARSIPGFDLCEGFSLCKDMLIQFGGHRQAAGLRLESSMLEEFERKINSVVQEKVRDFTPSLTIDADVSLKEINFALIKELQGLEPYGYGNPEPLFGSRGLEAVGPRIVGNNHLKMRLRHNSSVVEAIGFDMGGFMEKLEGSLTVDAVFTPTVNDWEGGRTLQLNLKALRPSAT